MNRCRVNKFVIVSRREQLRGRFQQNKTTLIVFLAKISWKVSLKCALHYMRITLYNVQCQAKLITLELKSSLL